jgi:hypothetical protein
MTAKKDKIIDGTEIEINNTVKNNKCKVQETEGV